MTVLLLVYALFVTGCAAYNTEGTLGSLKNVDIEIKEEVIVGSLEKALESYQRYLDETPETAMTPEAIRRLADLKIEKEYSAAETSSSSSPVIDVSDAAATAATASAIKSVDSAQADKMDVPGTKVLDTSEATAAIMASDGKVASNESGAIADISESEKEFSERATREQKFNADDTSITSPTGKAEDLQVAGAMEAIELYKGLLINCRVLMKK
jgi:hypothetical protein